MRLATLLLLAMGVCAAAVSAEEAVASTTHVRGRRLTETDKGYHFVSNLKSYEVHDFHLDRSVRRALRETANEATLSLDLAVLGRRMTLDLERHDTLFSKNFQHHYLDGNSKLIKTETLDTSCHYIARVRGDERARGAFSLCGGGFHGTLHSGDSVEAFTVQPRDPAGLAESFMKGEEAETSEHVVYKHSDVEDKGYKCGVENFKIQYTVEPVPEADDPPSGLRGSLEHEAPSAKLASSEPQLTRPAESVSGGRQLAAANQKIVSVLVVNDHARFLQYGAATQLHASQLMGVANSLFAQLGTFVPSEYGVTLEIAGMYTFSLRDPWHNTPDIYNGLGEAFVGDNQPANAGKGLLPAFNTWRKAFASGIPGNPANQHDLGHLLSGHEFQTSTIGLANMHGVCNADTKSGLTQAVNLADAQISSTIAHEIGHNLGLDHTNVVAPAPVNAACPNVEGKNWIMASSSAGVAHTDWSTCSVAWLKRHFAPGSTTYNSGAYTACAETSSGILWNSEPVCGDGIRQGNEQCDCPNKDCTGIDPCCDGPTCTLKAGKVCSAMDLCCDAATCAPKPAATVCRAAQSECDLAETCSGTDASCPEDTYKATGEACTTAIHSAAGTCFYKKCRDLIEQCKEASKQFEPDAGWVAPCNGKGETSGDAACEKVQCRTVGGSCGTFAGYVMPIEVGTQCAEGKGCYLGKCIPFASIPTPGNLNCSNGVVDQDESDVDCGGTHCFGCAAGKLCKASTDCVFPASCNTTTLYPGSNGTDYGLCSSVNNLNDAGLCPTCTKYFNIVADWIRRNPYATAGIIAGVLVLFGLLCCRPSHRDPKTGKKVNLAQRGMHTAQGSFRRFQQNGSFRQQKPMRSGMEERPSSIKSGALQPSGYN